MHDVIIYTREFKIDLFTTSNFALCTYHECVIMHTNEISYTTADIYILLLFHSSTSRPVELSRGDAIVLDLD